MSKANEIATQGSLTFACLNSADRISMILEECADIDNLANEVMGRIKVASGGSPAFNILEAGANELDIAKVIEGVILHSHKTNTYWSRPMEEGGENKTPDCFSDDGIDGLRTEDRKLVKCATCPFNQFGSDQKGKGKACRNGRRAFIVREGDMFPMILTIPPTALKAFNKYRVATSLSGNALHRVITKITVVSQKNSSGTAYSTPVFEMISALPVTDAERMHMYAKSIVDIVTKTKRTPEDYVTEYEVTAEAAQISTGAAPSFAPIGPVQTSLGDGFMQVDEDELPF